MASSRHHGSAHNRNVMTVVGYSEGTLKEKGLTGKAIELASTTASGAASGMQEVGCRGSHQEMAAGGQLASSILLAALLETGDLARSVDWRAVQKAAGTITEEVTRGATEVALATEPARS